MGTAGFRFVHGVSVGSRQMQRNCIRTEGLRREVQSFVEDWSSFQRNLQRSSGNEGASDSKTALSGVLFPHGLQIDADGRKNGHVQNGEKILRQILS